MQNRFISFRYYYECWDSSYLYAKCHENYTDFNGISYELCIPNYDLCDGIPHCPSGSDEDFDRCLKYFPDNTASYLECDAIDIYNNKTVRIKAIRCDGIVECKDNLDENGCKVENDVLLLTIGLGLAILLILTILSVASVDINDTKEHKGILLSMLSQNIGLEVLKNLQPLIVISQRTNLQKAINLAFLQHLKYLFNYDFSLVMKTVKV